MTIFCISIVRVAVVIFCILQRCGFRKEDQVTDWSSPENFQDRNPRVREMPSSNFLKWNVIINNYQRTYSIYIQIE